MLKLYYAPGTCALASHIALEEAGADYTTERLDFKATSRHSPEYLKVNPKGRVPALVTDHGVLTETPAMLAYHRAELSAKRNWRRSTTPMRSRRCRPSTAISAPPCTSRMPTRRAAHRWATDEASFADMKRMMPRDHRRACFALIERDMLKGPWVMGEQLHDLRSLSLYARLWLEGDGVDVATLPKVLAHRQRMERAACGARRSLRKRKR